MQRQSFAFNAKKLEKPVLFGGLSLALGLSTKTLIILLAYSALQFVWLYDDYVAIAVRGDGVYLASRR